MSTSFERYLEELARKAQLKAAEELRIGRKRSAAEISESLGMPWFELPERPGTASKDRDPSWGPVSLDNSAYENDPTREQMAEYFGQRPEAFERLIYCPQVNVDMTDDWGMFGYEPGFLFVCGIKSLPSEDRYQSLSDLYFLENAQPVRTPSGQAIRQIPHYDFFPRRLWTQIITERRTPEAYAYLLEAYNTPPVEQPAIPGAPQTAIGAAVLGQITQG